MENRIREIRKNAKMTQTEFAEKLGLSRGFVARVETGLSTLSDRSIKDICRVFHVNEEWFRNGTGDMYNYCDDDVMDAIGDLIDSDDSALSQLIIKIVKEYNKLDDKSKLVIDNFIESLQK